MKKEYYTAHFKNELERGQQLINTTQLQLDSLSLFMKALGYVAAIPQDESWEVRNTIGLHGFEQFDRKSGLLPKFISFQNACSLHNWGGKNIVDNKWFYLEESPIPVPIDLYLVARSCRLVDRVKLQKCGKTVKVQDHWVKLIEDGE